MSVPQLSASKTCFNSTVVGLTISAAFAADDEEEEEEEERRETILLLPSIVDKVDTKKTARFKESLKAAAPSLLFASSLFAGSEDEDVAVEEVFFSFLHLSEQYLTLSQFFAQDLRHSIGLLHCSHILVGRFPFFLFVLLFGFFEGQG